MAFDFRTKLGFFSKRKIFIVTSTLGVCTVLFYLIHSLHRPECRNDFSFNCVHPIIFDEVFADGNLQSTILDTHIMVHSRRKPWCLLVTTVYPHKAIPLTAVELDRLISFVNSCFFLYTRSSGMYSYLREF